LSSVTDIIYKQCLQQWNS